MPQENISILIDAVNKASKDIQAVSADLAKMSGQVTSTQSTMSKFSRSLSSVGQQLRRGGTVLTASITLPLVLLAKQAFKTSQEFEQSMANAFSVMGDVADDTKKKLTEFAEELGKKTAFRASEAADAMYKLASAGLSAKEVMGALPGVLDLAAATQSDLASAAEQTAIAMKVFGLAAEDAQKITDSFVAGIAASNLNFDRISQAMKFAGSAMAGFGKNVEETVSALAVFADIGIFGFKAGSGLRRILSSLANPTGDLAEVMSKLNIELKDIDPAANSLGQIFDQLQKSGITASDAFKAFGQISAPIVIGVLKQANDEGVLASQLFAEMEQQMGATGKAAEVASIQLDTLNGEMLKLKSSTENVFLQFKKDVFGESIKETVKSIRLFVDRIAELDADTKKNIVTFLAFAAALGPILLILGALAAAITALLTKVGAVVVIITLLAAGLAKISINTVIANQAFKEWNAEMANSISKNNALVASLDRVADVMGEDIPKSVIDAQKAVLETENELIDLEVKIAEAQKKMHGRTLKRLQAEKEMLEGNLQVAKDALKAEVEANVDASNEIFKDTERLAMILERVGEIEFKRRVALIKERGARNEATNREILRSDQRLTVAQIAELDKLNERITRFLKPETKKVVIAVQTQLDATTSALFGKSFTSQIVDWKTQITGALSEIGKSAEEDLAGDDAGGGVGGASKDATADVEALRDSLQDMQDDLAEMSAEFRRDVKSISDSIAGAMGEEVIPDELILSYDTLQEGIKGVKKDVDDLINAHNKFTDEAQKGLDEYLGKVRKLRDEAVSDVLTSYNEALGQQAEIQKELADAEGDRRAELEAESAANQKIIGEYNALISGAEKYATELEKTDERIKKLQDNIARLTEEGAHESTISSQVQALENAEKDRLILIGKQILATEELDNLKQQQADREYKAKLSDIELTALQLAQDQKRLDDLKKINEAIAGGTVSDLNLEELIAQGLSQDAIDLANTAIQEEANFKAGLDAQLVLLDKYKEAEVELYQDTNEAIAQSQSDLEDSLNLSYDRLIVKLAKVQKAAEDAFAAAQKVGVGGGGGAGVPGAFNGGQFAGGGYTGAGNIHNIAGVVHKGEWVAPNWMVKAFRPMFGQLESMRRNKVRGFEEGGMVDGGKTFNQPITINATTHGNADFGLIGDYLKFQLRGL